MDQNDQTQRMYQQYPARDQSAMQNAYAASAMAARFRHPLGVHQSPSNEVASNFSGAGVGFLDHGQIAGNPIQGGYSYPQFNNVEPTAYSSQGHHQPVHYGHPGFYSNQQNLPAGQTSQDQLQRYPSGPARNPSMSSPSSQYSVPHTPQSQYFSSQTGQIPATRTSEVGTPVASASFESSSAATYAQPAYGHYDPPGQMLPPSHFGGYRRGSQQQTVRNVQEVDEAYETYQNKAREIFTLVRDGRLRETQTHLLYISQYLLGNAEALGLGKDDNSLYEERLKLWDTFNHTWLTALQAQLDLTRDMIARGSQQLPQPQTLLGVDDMDKLGHELVRLCDGVSVFGLVDYQMGVAEEEILELLIKCLDLLDPAQGAHDSPRQPAGTRGTVSQALGPSR